MRVSNRVLLFMELVITSNLEVDEKYYCSNYE